MRRHVCSLVAMICVVGVLSARAAPARADGVVSETLHVPVRVLPSPGTPLTQNIDVAVIRNDGTQRRPFLLLLHGRSADPAERARLALPIYPANTHYLAVQGFVVLIPLRIGYGILGGPDLEATGACDDKHFTSGILPALEETRQVLAYAATLPYVDTQHGIVMGESFGGLVAIAAAAAPWPGVVAAVSIAGGDGGDSLHRPDRPCGAERLLQTFAAYGAANRVPTLWLYSANDRLWGVELPRAWYAAFVGAGGHGEFAELPADKNNGHFIFNRNAAAWHPAFERFIASLALNAATH